MRPRLWDAVLVALLLGFVWDIGPQRLARAAYVAFRTVAPKPSGFTQIPDRFREQSYQRAII